MSIGRRTRVTPPSPPPWWGTNGSSPRRAQVVRRPSRAVPVPPSPELDEAYGDTEPAHRAEDQVPGHEPGGGPTAGYAPNAAAACGDVPVSPEPTTELPHEAEQTRAPRGEYVHDTFGHPSHDRPEPQPAETVSPASAMAPSPLPAGRWVAHEQDGQGLFLPSGRAADDTRAARTTVDRPVAALRPVGIDEARQLAECFALDYLSCDEDDPGRRRVALEPYLSRRSDALLGWPGEKPGRGRWRAVHARAGEVLPYSHGVTVDVKVLVEVFARTPADQRSTSDAEADERPPTEAAAENSCSVPELPLGGRWSAVPGACAPGWTHEMSIWQRLGIPIRRHDLGHLVVELFELPSTDDA